MLCSQPFVCTSWFKVCHLFLTQTWSRKAESTSGVKQAERKWFSTESIYGVRFEYNGNVSTKAKCSYATYAWLVVFLLLLISKVSLLTFLSFPPPNISAIFVFAPWASSSYFDLQSFLKPLLAPCSLLKRCCLAIAGEPNHANGEENCVEIYHQVDSFAGRWNDLRCDGTLSYVCMMQKDPSLSPGQEINNNQKCRNGWMQVNVSFNCDSH